MDNNLSAMTAALQSLQQRAYYPSPFFDTARLYMPNNIKEMIKWCRFYFYTHPTVSNVITNKAEYPITDFVVETEDAELKKQYEAMLKTLKMRDFLIQVGLDHLGYGNCFVSINYPFIRFLQCDQCGHKANIENIEYKISNYTPTGKCQSCGGSAKYKIDDIALKDVSQVRLKTWDPMNIEIEHNEITGDTNYYLLVPGKVRRGIMAGKSIYWNTTPKWVIDAIKDDKLPQFKPGKLYHYKRFTLTDENSEWGKSVELPVLRDIFHFYTLRKAQEAIAIDRIIPLKYLYPESQGGNIEPLYGKVDLSEWRKRIEEQLLKWKADPLYIATFPIPIGQGSIGGDGKALMVFPEMEATDASIEKGLGLPPGLSSGTTSYAAGSVALRMMENSIINDRNKREEIMLWTLQEVSTYLGIPFVPVRLREFKMGDDMQRKQMLLGLNSQGKLSDATMLSEFDLSADAELEAVMSEMAERNKQYMEVNLSLMDVIRGFVNQMNNMDEQSRSMFLSKMQQDMPETYNMVSGRVQPQIANQPSNNNPVRPPK